jgi:membrane protease YdiL (CAAX protease family)
MSNWYMINFFVSVIPMGFVTTWVYVKNGRSMLASILFHLFVNFIQEKVAMTQNTKCIETLMVTVAAIIIVLTNRDMFFEKRHIGHILE